MKWDHDRMAFCYHGFESRRLHQLFRDGSATELKPVPYPNPHLSPNARVMELADMTVSKTVVRKNMRVRIPPLAPKNRDRHYFCQKYLLKNGVCPYLFNYRIINIIKDRIISPITKIKTIVGRECFILPIKPILRFRLLPQ